MQHHQHYMILTLPDQTMAVMDTNTLRFCNFLTQPTSWEQAIAERMSADPKPESNAQIQNINVVDLANFMEMLHLRFNDCFKRLGPQARYSFRYARQNFDIRSLTRVYQFGGMGSGGMFCSSHSEWRFLDGGIVSHSGYGWGSYRWIGVVGTEALRVVCLFFGVKQPLRIKGEGRREPLAALLERMTGNDVGHGSRSYYYAGQKISETTLGKGR
jgi:hypothetical protein